MKNYYFMSEGKLKSVSVIYGKLKEFAESQSLKEADFIEESKCKDIDKEFIDSYIIENKKLKLDIEKAKKIKMDEIRFDRNAYLKESDFRFLITLENEFPGDTDAIKNVRKKLRDITKSKEFDSIKTLEDLKSYDPLSGIEAEMNSVK